MARIKQEEPNSDTSQYAGLGKVITLLRISLNLKLSELSEKSGVSEIYIRELEKGVKCNPSDETLGKIGIALETDLDTLKFFATDFLTEKYSIRKMMYLMLDKIVGNKEVS